MRRDGEISRTRDQTPVAASWASVLAKVLLGSWTLACAMVVPTVAGCEAEPPDNCASGVQQPCEEQAAALKENSAALRELTAGIVEATNTVGELAETVELAAVHRRLSDIELLLRQWHPVSCPVQQCTPQGVATKRDDGECRDAAEAATFDTIGPCVRREKVGEFTFAPGTVEIVDQAAISKVAKQIKGELRYVFAVGYGDDAAFSWPNVNLGLRRARVVADALVKELATSSADGSDTKPNYIRVASGVEWTPTTAICPSDEQGKVGVYLVWHGRSPLCKSGPATAMTTRGEPSTTAQSRKAN